MKTLAFVKNRVLDALAPRYVVHVIPDGGNPRQMGPYSKHDAERVLENETRRETDHWLAIHLGYDFDLESARYIAQTLANESVFMQWVPR